MTFRCSICGEEFEGFSFAFDSPDPYANLPEAERETRAKIFSDQCTIDNQWFFVRGCLEVPIIGRKDPFLWGIWASVTQKNFDRIDELWETEGRESEPRIKGRLANDMKVAYPNVLDEKIEIRLQPRGTRPLFVVEDAKHPLAIDQLHGITMEKAHLIASRLMHS